MVFYTQRGGQEHSTAVDGHILDKVMPVPRILNI